MIYYQKDGTIKSYDNDTNFGWYSSELEVLKYETNVKIQKVNSEEKQNVFEEKCKSCQGNDTSVYEPPIQNIIDLLDSNSLQDKLLLSIICPALVKNKGINTTDSVIVRKSKQKLDDNFQNSDYGIVKKLKIYSDEPIKSLENKLKEVDDLLKEIKEEINKMHQILNTVKQGYIDDDNTVDDLIQKTIFYTEDISNTKFLDDMILLLNNNNNVESTKNWPFYTDSTFCYSKSERNYIV